MKTMLAGSLTALCMLTACAWASDGLDIGPQAEQLSRIQDGVKAFNQKVADKDKTREDVDTNELPGNDAKTMAAIQSCLLAPAISALSQVARPMIPDRVPRCIVFPTDDVRENYYYYGSCDIQSYTDRYRRYVSYRFYTGVGLSGGEPLINVEYYVDGRTIKLEAPFPRLRFRPEGHSNDGYDRLGEPINPRAIRSKPYLDGDTTGGVVFFKNSTTDQPTDVAIDTLSYQSCLKENILGLK